MARDKPSPQSPETAEQAMNLVLQAEREAEQAIRACERDAHRILLDAQNRAQRIAARTDERMTLIRMQALQRVTQEIKALERAEKATQHAWAVHHVDKQRLAEIVRDIAAHLTGEEGDTGP
jgi:hypothetical protein